MFEENNEPLRQNNFNEVLGSSNQSSSNDEVLQPRKEPSIQQERKPEGNGNSFANNFPGWDLLPPYQTVRRINRK